MPKPEHSCFISYRHGHGVYATRALSDFLEALESRLEQYLDGKIYIDKEGLRAGVIYPSALAKALCESACLVVIYWPTYFSAQHTYCTREFMAMEALETQRVTSIKEMKEKNLGLIIPIVFTGASMLPAKIAESRYYQDFTGYRLGGRKLYEHPQFEDKIIEIAEYITECYDILDSSPEDICGNCGSFELPTPEEALVWLDTYDIRRRKKADPGFPGREEL
jgi:hypothetical protein